MQFRHMTKKETEAWYAGELCATFAEQERKPLSDILDLVEKKRYEVWGLFDGGALLGYATLWKDAGVPHVLVDYLGVTAARRNGGLGANILSLLKEQGGSIVLESELPEDGAGEAENALRARRIGFYARNGFTPAYRMATCGLAFQALVFDPAGAPAEDIMAWHKALYGPARTDVQVPLPEGCRPKLPYWMT